MCLQCVTNAEMIIPSVLSITTGDNCISFHLMQAKVDSPEWKAGHYGLVICNDPSFIIPRIVENPYFSLSEEEYDSLCVDPTQQKIIEAVEDLHYEVANEAADQISNVHPSDGWLLIQACMEAGYSFKTHGYAVEYWLTDFLARKVRENLESKS